MSESITPTFSGEVQFRRYSDTSTQGVQIVLALHDRESMKPFIGKEGKRFMAVLVEIGDDEQPMSGKEIAKPKEREQLGELCYRAVLLCNDPEFQEWIEVVFDKFMDGNGEGGDLTPAGYTKQTWARQAILTMCEASSRKQLDTNHRCGSLFRQLISRPWQKYQLARRAA